MKGELYDQEWDRTLEDSTEKEADGQYDDHTWKDNKRNKSGTVQHTKV